MTGLSCMTGAAIYSSTSAVIYTMQIISCSLDSFCDGKQAVSRPRAVLHVFLRFFCLAAAALPSCYPVAAVLFLLLHALLLFLALRHCHLLLVPRLRHRRRDSRSTQPPPPSSLSLPPSLLSSRPLLFGDRMTLWRRAPAPRLPAAFRELTYSRFDCYSRFD